MTEGPFIRSGNQWIQSQCNTRVCISSGQLDTTVHVWLTEDQWNKFSKETDEAFYGDSLPSSEALDTDSMSRDELVSALNAKQAALYATWEALEHFKQFAEDDGFDIHRTLREVRFALKAGREVTK